MSERSGRRGLSPGWGVVGLLVLLPVAGCRHHARSTTSRSYPPPLPRGTDDADGRVVGEGEARVRPPARPVTPPRSSSGTAPGPVAGGEIVLHGAPFQTEVGMASWYGPPYSGRKGADGSVYDQNAMTAAHLSLALGTVVRVTNLETGQQAVVRITDRGPFVQGRILDLSLRAAKEIGVYRAGVVRVRVEAFNQPAPKPGSFAGGRWCVQIGAFATQGDARQEQADLRQRYPGSTVLAFQGPTGWWVRINPKVADRGHAQAVEDSIHLPDAAQPYMVRTD